MKYTASLFGVLALVGTLTLPLHAVFADDVKTVTSGTSAAGTPSTPPVIGKVSYLLGQANMILPNGAVIAITKQTEILEGSKISVKERSKLNLQMVDGATEKLLANSTLEFTQYHYDPADPKGSEIRKELIEGEVTSKTGVGGKAAKERYRLNSPLAAIAVLGTEYTVSISGGETRVVVKNGIISMAKLGGSCQRSGLGACAGGEQLSENQRGLALIVTKDQARPVLIPASTPPPTKSDAQTTSAKEQAEEDAANKKAAEEAAAKEKESKLAADKKAADEAAAAKEKASKLAADKKAADEETAAKEKASKLAADKKAADEEIAAKEKVAAKEKAAADKQDNAQATANPPAAKSEEKASDKSTDKASVKETPVLVAEKSTDKVVIEVTKKVDERDPFAEVKTEVKEVKAEVKVVTPPPTVVAVAPKTPIVVEPVTQPVVAKIPDVAVADVSKPTSTLESSQPNTLFGSPSTSDPLTPATPSLPNTLVSAGGGGSDGGFGTGFSGELLTPSITPLVVNKIPDLVETNKNEGKVTTDTGQVIAVVTPPVVTPPAVVTPTPVPVTPAPVLPPMRLGKYDPATVVDGTTLGTQVDNLYAQIVAPTATNGYAVERLKTASASLPEQRDVGFALEGSSAANVRNATTGAVTAATLTDATLNVSSVRNTFATGFTLNSPVYTGAVKATGTYSALTGTLVDDRTNPQTTINGGVGVLGDAIGAGYTFTHQIDTVLSADGALNWTGTALAATPTTSVGTTLGN
jgi:hypothetical protein